MKLKRMATILILISAGVFLSSNMLLAESTSIRIACTIPEIPGENVPLVNEDGQDVRLENQTEEGEILLAEKKEETDSLMFQKETEELRSVEGQRIALNLQTIYSR